MLGESTPSAALARIEREREREREKRERGENRAPS
jgi:hypothetical protein